MRARKLSWPALLLSLALSAPCAAAEYRARLRAPASPAQIEALRAAGLEVLEAEPKAGFVLRARAPLDRVGLEAAGVELEPLSAEDRLEPGLRPYRTGEARPEEAIWLRALTWRGADCGPTAALLRPLVAEGELLQVQDAAGRGHVWLRVEPAKCGPALRALSAQPDVAWVERWVDREIKNDNSSWLIQSGSEELGRTVFEHGLTGTGQVVAVADSGLDVDACQFRYGPGRDAVTTAIGWPQPPGAVQDRPDHKLITYYLVGEAEEYDDGTGYFHGTHTAGNVLGDNYAHPASRDDPGRDAHDGMAPGAQLVMQDIGANDGSLRGLRGVSSFDLMKQARETGARIHNNSYGYSILSVSYDADSATIDEAAWRLNDMLILFAAGNSGYDWHADTLQPRSLGGTGSTSKNTLVVGASGPVELDMYGSYFELADDLLFFSSQGPTADGRIKPDLVAPGMVFSARSHYSSRIRLGCCDIYGDEKSTSNVEDDNCDVDTDWPTPGTSFSSPIVAGAATLTRQYFVEGFWLAGQRDEEQGFNPTNALLKACLIAGATPLPGEIMLMGESAPLSPVPSFEQGWGRAYLEGSLAFEGDARSTLVIEDALNPAPDNPMPASEPAPFPYGLGALRTGQARSWTLPASSAGPLAVCLVWSDPPARPGAAITLVNDLDLELRSASGQRYAGNQGFEGGFSQPVDEAARDERNNVECIRVASPGDGTFEASVRARSVPGNGEPGSDRQGYALVAIGEFERPEIDSLQPDRLSPGELLRDVEIRGAHFVPGCAVDFGPGVIADRVEVLDEGTIRIGRLVALQDAECGARDLHVSIHHSLRAVREQALHVGGEGCGCGAAGAETIPVCLLGIGLLCALRRRPRRDSRTGP
ncbi:MAG: S8 family serine peptidase [Deltaproteobacteria bacterium]|nr:S8 family serine peptidase [Deltaproteobacteria bacterium]